MCLAMLPSSTKEPAFHFIFALSFTVLQPARTTRADPGLLQADQVTSDGPKRKIRQHHLNFDFPFHTSYPGKSFLHKLNYIIMNLKSVMHILQREGETFPFMKLHIRDLPFYFGIDQSALCTLSLLQHIPAVFKTTGIYRPPNSCCP